MGNCIYEGVVLLVTPDLTNEESSVEYEAKDKDDEEDDSQY